MLISLVAAALAHVVLLHVRAQSAPSAVDYIVVGGGTAGCTLAARLCAGLPDATVLLLERGAPRNATEELLVRCAPYLGRHGSLTAWKVYPNMQAHPL